MKKVENTKELGYIFVPFWRVKLLYMDITEHETGESYFRVINRKGITNVYLLEADDVEKINARIKDIYAKITTSNIYYNYSSFDEIMRISQELTKNVVVPRSVPTGLYVEDSFYRGIFVAVSSAGD